MLLNFDELFGDDYSQDIPKSIIDTLSEKLPENLTYKKISEEACIVCNDNEETNLTFNIKDIFEKLNLKSINEFEEYLYNSQEIVEINTDKVYIDGKEVSVNDIIKEPFSQGVGNAKMFIKAPEPEPQIITLLCSEISKVMTFKRKPSKDINIIIVESIDKGPLILKYIIDSKKKRFKVNFKIDSSKAENIDQVIEALTFYKYFVSGELFLDKFRINEKGEDIEIEAAKESLKFWEKVKAISKKLAVEFKPVDPVRVVDFETVKKLYISLIENLAYKEFLNINSFILTSSIKEEIAKLLDKKNSSFIYIKSKEIEILNEKFNVWILEIWLEFEVNDVKEEVLGENYKYEIFITPKQDKGIVRIQKIFLLEEEAKSAFDSLKDNSLIQKAKLLK